MFEENTMHDLADISSDGDIVTDDTKIVDDTKYLDDYLENIEAKFFVSWTDKATWVSFDIQLLCT